MILAFIFFALAVACALAFPRRDTRDYSRGYRELRAAAQQAELGAALWKRAAEKGKKAETPVSEGRKVVNIDRRRA